MSPWHSLILFVTAENVFSAKQKLGEILKGTRWEHLKLEIRDMAEHAKSATLYRIKSTPALVLRGNKLKRVFHDLDDELSIRAALGGTFPNSPSS